ncbi:hypothetical protein [Helcococcus kunzii]|uniref:hypothetical protein n=1 Tax=Helcococcus kunzii TaxID=40091 RepID=UPI0024AD5058|nr:hypothetical protein [Helcococcus kunzii]
MKKKKLIILFLFLTLLLSACGIQSKENMKVNNNFKGERLILLSMDAETFNRARGGKDAVINFFTDNVIEPLELNYVKDEANLIEVEYSLKFSSKEDYLNKVNTLYKLGKIEENINLDFEVQNVRFNKGIKFNDSSDVQKLLSPLINKALEDGLFYEDDLEKLWDTKQYSLTINDKEYIKDSFSEYGKYSESKYIGPNEIKVITSRANEANKFNRQITLIFNKENYSKLDNDWEDDFIEDDKVRFVEDDENSTAKFIYENFTQEEINKATQKFFAVDSNFSMTYKNTGQKLKTIETLTDFIKENEIDKKAKVKYLYYFDKKAIDTFPKDLSEIQDNNERIILAERDELNQGIEKTVETDIVFDKIEVETKLSENSFYRTINFPKKRQEEIVNKNLVEYLKSLGISYTDSEESVKIEYNYNLDSGSDIHNKLYKNGVIVEELKGKPFKSNKKIVEVAQFKELRAEKIENVSKTVDLTRISNEKFKQKDNQGYSYSITFETTTFSTILNVFATIGSVILIIFLIFRHLSKGNIKLDNDVKMDAKNTEKKDKSKRKTLD